MRWMTYLWLAALACQSSWCARVAAAEWEHLPVSPEDQHVVALAVDPALPTHVLAASSRAVHESFGDGSAWEERFRVPAQTAITAIAYGPSAPSTILAATDAGLYGSFDGGQQWSRLFKGTGEGQAACTHVAFHPSRVGIVLLGTRGGLFLSIDGGRHWNAASIPSDAREVIHFAFDSANPDRIHLLTTQGVFTGTLADNRWEQKSSVLRAAEEQPETPDMAPEDAETPLPQLRTIAVHPKDPSTMYVGTSRGIRLSRDGGTTWQWMPSTGLGSTEISRLMLRAHSPVTLYAATAHGVARYDEVQHTWEMITTGLADGPTHDLAGSRHRLWAATDQGLFRYDVTPDPFGAPEPVDARALLGNFVREPSIGQVREAAIRYAEVHPNKIRLWRRQAALKALLPNVKFGLDHTANTNVHVDEGSFPNFQILETKDHDAGIDFSMTWELGNLIWNNDQTSIDTRSKLMVQLRDDIVNEVTRTYFERRRVQIALLTNPPKDDHALLEKELRIQELTALIDGLTGGYFSSQMATPANNGRL